MECKELDMMEVVDRNFGECTLQFCKREVQCEVLDSFASTFASLQQDVDLPQIPVMASEFRPTADLQRSDIPASKLYQSTASGDTLHNLVAARLENLNLRVGQVVLLQISDLLKELETTFYIMVSRWRRCNNSKIPS